MGKVSCSWKMINPKPIPAIISKRPIRPPMLASTYLYPSMTSQKEIRPARAKAHIDSQTKLNSGAICFSPNSKDKGR